MVCALSDVAEEEEGHQQQEHIKRLEIPLESLPMASWKGGGALEEEEETVVLSSRLALTVTAELSLRLSYNQTYPKAAASAAAEADNKTKEYLNKKMTYMAIVVEIFLAIEHRMNKKNWKGGGTNIEIYIYT